MKHSDIIETIAEAKDKVTRWCVAGEAEAKRAGLPLDKNTDGTFVYAETTVAVEMYVKGCIATYTKLKGML